MPWRLCSSCSRRLRSPGSTSGVGPSRPRRCGRWPGPARRSSRPVCTCSSGWSRCARERRDLAPALAARRPRPFVRMAPERDRVAAGGCRRGGVTAYGAVEAATPSVSRFELASPQLPAEFDGARVALVTDVHAGRCAAPPSPSRSSTSSTSRSPTSSCWLATSSTARPRATPPSSPRSLTCAPRWVFATTGNHEMFEDTVNWVSAFEDVGLVVLGNESVPLEQVVGRPWCWRAFTTPSAKGSSHRTTTRLPGRRRPRGLHAARRPPAVAGLRRRGPRSRPPGLRAHPRRSDVADQLPRALQQPMLEGRGDVAGTPVITSRGAGAWGRRSGWLFSEVPIITLKRS